MIPVNPYHVLSLRPNEEFPCLSLFASSDKELANLLNKAEEIGLKKYDAKTMDTLLKPIHQFLKRQNFQNNEAPFALFSTAGFSGCSRLPFNAKPLVVVSNSFHVKPLLKWMQREHPFCLLHLKGREARLYQGSLSHFELVEELAYDELRSMDGTFNALDRAVYRTIQSSRVPLLLAGEYDLTEAYRSVSGYKAIVDDVILDPSVLDDSEKFHQAAIQVLEPFLALKENYFVNAYWAAERVGKTSSVLQEIIELALTNKIKHLFINEKMHVWGSINTKNASFTYSPFQTSAEDDVLDDLAELVWKSHKTVTILEADRMPHGAAACAILSSEIVPPRRNKEKFSYDSGLQPQAS